MRRPAHDFGKFYTAKAAKLNKCSLSLSYLFFTVPSSSHCSFGDAAAGTPAAAGAAPAADAAAPPAAGAPPTVEADDDDLYD